MLFTTGCILGGSNRGWNQINFHESEFYVDLNFGLILGKLSCNQITENCHRLANNLNVGKRDQSDFELAR